MRVLLANFGTVVIGVLLLAAVIAILASLIRRRKKGQSSCGCGCANCPGASACHKR